MQSGQAAHLVFVVQSTDSTPSTGAPSRRADAKIDYRAVLSAADFALFSTLRDERRKIAEEEGVPVYTIFSNAQLALLVEHKVKTSEEMLAIEGIGAARVERYAKRILPLLGGGA